MRFESVKAYAFGPFRAGPGDHPDTCLHGVAPRGGVGHDGGQNLRRKRDGLLQLSGQGR